MQYNCKPDQHDIHAVLRVVDTYTDCIWCGCSGGYSIPTGWLCLLDMSLLWQVWWRILTEAESRLCHVLLYSAPLALHAGTHVSFEAHTLCFMYVHVHVQVTYICIAIVNTIMSTAVSQWHYLFYCGSHAVAVNT